MIWKYENSTPRVSGVFLYVVSIRMVFRYLLGC